MAFAPTWMVPPCLTMRRSTIFAHSASTPFKIVPQRLEHRELRAEGFW
jgi:hypothetical protein